MVVGWLKRFTTNDCMDAGGRAPTVGSLRDRHEEHEVFDCELVDCKYLPPPFKKKGEGIYLIKSPLTPLC